MIAGRRRKARWGITLAGIGALLVLAGSRGAIATVSGSGTDISSSQIASSSGNVAVIGVDLITNAIPLADSLSSVTVNFTNVSGFTSSDLSSNGVKLFRDNGTTADALDAGDSAVTSTATFNNDCSGGTCTATLTVTNGTMPSAHEGSYTYFVVVSTSNTIGNSDQFKVGLGTTSFVALPGPATFTAVTTQTISAVRTTASATSVAPTFVKADSDQISVFGISMTTASAAQDTLSSAKVTFTHEAGGFSTSDLTANVDGTSDDGVQLWRDTSTTGSNEDALDSGDTAVSSGFSWTGDCALPLSTCTATFTILDGTIPTASSGTYTYFLAVKTSGAIPDGDQFSATLPTDAFTTTPHATTITSAASSVITADVSPPSDPTVTAVGLSKAAGKVRVLGTQASSETSAVLEVWKTTAANCSALTQVTESALRDLSGTNADLVGTTTSQRTALQGITAGSRICYRVRDAAGNRSGFVADGVVPAAPTSGDAALLYASNVANLKKVYASQDSSARTFRLYVRPGGSGLERTESQTNNAFVEVTTSTSGGATSGTTNIRQLGDGTTLASGDGIAYSLTNSDGNDSDVVDDGVIPSAPGSSEQTLLSVSAADGHQRLVAGTDSSPGRSFGLYVDPAGGTAWTRAVSASGGTTPVRVTTASSATSSGTTTVFSGGSGTTALAASQTVAFVGVDSGGNESDLLADGSIPAAPVAGNISFSDATDTFTVNPIPSTTAIDLYVGAAGANASASYDGTADGEATSTSPATVSGEFASAQTLFYTALNSSTGNESAITSDGTIPAVPSAGDIALLSTSAADGHKRIIATADSNAGRVFELYIDTAGGTNWTRASTTSGGSTAVTVTTQNGASADSGTTTIFAGTTALSGSHAVGYSYITGGNESDATGDGIIPAAPDATATSVSDALDTFTATAATSTYRMNLYLGNAGASASQAYDGTPDATATSSSPISVSPSAANTVFYTAIIPATGNESRTTADGDIPVAPVSPTDTALLGASAAQGNQRVIATQDNAGAGRIFELYIDTAGGTNWARATSVSGGSTQVTVTTSSGTNGADSGTTTVYAGTTALAAGHAVGYSLVNANGNDSAVTADGAIPAVPDISTTSATAARDRITASGADGTNTVRAFAGASNDAATAYAEGADATLTSSTPATVDVGTGDSLFYTLKNASTGNESAIVADGTIPAAPDASATSASGALKNFVVPSASGSNTVNIYLGTTDAGATWDDGADYTASASPKSVAPDVLPAGNSIYYTNVTVASGNESEMSADGIVPSAPVGANNTMSASAAEQKLTANPDSNSRTLRLYGDPAGGTTWVRATTTGGGSAPVEITTSTSVATQSGSGIYLSGGALTSGASVAYSRVQGGNDSALTTDGTIPSAPSGASNFSADAEAAAATIGSGAATGTYRVFAATTPVSVRVSHTNGSADAVTTTGLANGDAVGYALTDGNDNESPVLSDGIIPTVTTPDLLAASDSGSSSTDNITNDTTPSFHVTTEASNDVTVFEGATSRGTAPAGGGGVATITTSALGDGAHVLKAQATNAAGNASSKSATRTVTIDTALPVAPGIPNLAAASDSGVSAIDDLTNDDTPTFDVTGAESGATVTVYEGVTSLGSATANGSGIASPTASALSEGTHSVSAKQTDVAGNTSSASSGLAIQVDTTAPSAPDVPDLVDGSDSGISATDDLTNDATPSFSLSGAEAGSTLSLVDDVTAVGTGTADGSGIATITASSLADATHDVAVKATDAAGNEGTASSALPVTIDTTAPAAPAVPDLVVGSDTGSSATDEVTNDTTPAVDVTGAEADSSVVLYDGSTEVAAGTADGSGAVTLTASALADAVHSLSATSTDAAGNDSSGSSALSVTVDTAAPAAPSTPDLVSASDTGVSATDNITRDPTPTFDVTTEPNAAVTLYEGALSLGTATANGSGTALPTASVLVDGAHSVKALATDVAGNTGAFSSTLGVTIDTSGSTFTPLPVARIYGTGAPKLVAGHDRDINVLGVGGVPSSGVDAVVVNVEVFSPSTSGYLRVTPTGAPSATAVQEFAAGKTVSNLVTVAVGTGGKINLHLSAGSANIFVDVEGYDGGTSSDLYHPLPVARIYGTSAPRLIAGADRDVTVTGVGGVPSSGVDAVMVNVEVAAPTANGYVRVTPAGSSSQTAVQEFTVGQTVSNLVAAKVGTGGKITLHLSAGSALTFVDVEGYYSSPSVSTGDVFHPLSTARLYGTGAPSLVAGTDRDITVVGLAGVPSANVDAVVVNVEVFSPTTAGYIRVTPAGSSSQTAVQEFVPGQTISNLVVVKVGPGGKITLHLSAGSAKVFVDVQGYYNS